MKQLFFAFILLLLQVRLLQGQERFSTVKIKSPEAKVEKANLIGLLEIDHYYIQEGYIIAELSQREIKRLKNSSRPYEIVVPDIAEKNEELNRLYFSATPQQKVAMEQSGNTADNIITTPAAFNVWPSFGGFYSFAQMNAAMNNLVAAYPSLVQKTSLGLTTGGRDIWCIKISDNAATDEPNEAEVLYIGLQHAREAIGGSSMIFFMQYLCENYATDTRIQQLVNNRELFIIPCMNPDGWEYNRINNPSGGGGWRKNRKNNGDGTFGVDLNRNWSVDWANCAGAGSSCGSSVSSSDVYWGTSAFSENETNAIRNFVKTRNFAACIDQHAFGPYYSLPFGRAALHTGADSLTIMQQQFYNVIPAQMGKYNGMRAGNSIQSVGYEVAGGVKDWMLKGEIGSGTKGIVLGITGEGGAGGGTGGSYGSFWPPASEIVGLCKGMTYQNIQLAMAAGSYVDIEDNSEMAVLTPNSSFGFNVKRIGVEDRPVTVSLIPLENIATVGSPVVINSLPFYYDTYDGVINYTLRSGIQSGHRIRFVWKVETGGIEYYDTVTKFYNPIQLFYDDMEGSNINTNWAVTGNWNYTSNQFYTGARSLTESPGGLYGANRFDTLRCRTVFNLSDATAAYITFWIRHRAENFRDILQLQVSTNGINWTAIDGRTTVKEPGTLDGSRINGQPSLTGIREEWAPEIFNLGNYIGQASVQFRLVFSSDANTTGYDFQVDEGFNIDNIRFIKSTTNLIILPSEFLSFTGRLTPANTVELNWDAVVDDEHDYFIVERSADGNLFLPIGTVRGGKPYSFTDKYPSLPVSYYRLKAVDKNGGSKNSRMIMIRFLPESYKLSVYPNPATAFVTLQLAANSNQPLKINIYGTDGKKVWEQYAAPAEYSTVQINTSGWAPQLYVVQIITDNNQVVMTRKFLKQ